jgi:hypothetical protein
VIDQTVLRQLRAYATRLERDAPGVLAGLYGVGSVALGDFRPPLSNIDVVAVSGEPWSPAALRLAVRAGVALRLRRQPPRICCITWDDLAADPAGLDVTCFLGRRRIPSIELANPLTWQVLRTSAVSVHGPEYPDIGVGDLRGWAADRLSGWWGSWVRHRAGRAGTLLDRRSTTERVLEVARLVQIVSSGRVVSKAEAGELALGSSGERFQRILKDAVGFRQGLRASMYWGPFERKRDVIAFILAASETRTGP